MAATLLGYEVSDLCIGKPALRSLPISATVADALYALKISQETFLSVWVFDHSANVDRCIGKVCMVDVICYLCREENRKDPLSALNLPVSDIVLKGSGIVRHVEPNTSLLVAIDLILEGTQNLVVPIKSNTRNPRRKLQQKDSLCSSIHNGVEYCWITQEDVIRFLLNLIGLFSPIPALSVRDLHIVSTDILSVGYHDTAASALGAISKSHILQTSVAVIDQDGHLIGELSPATLVCCDESVAAAITTLSAGDLMSYIDYGGPPEDIVRVVKARLRDRKLKGMLELFEELPMSSSSSSSDDEFSPFPVSPLLPSPSPSPPPSTKYSPNSYSARMMRRVEPIVCHSKSSLVAVMIQALTHRVNYVWVLEDDYSLAGIVTFSDMLKIFRDHLQSKLKQ